MVEGDILYRAKYKYYPYLKYVLKIPNKERLNQNSCEFQNQ